MMNFQNEGSVSCYIYHQNDKNLNFDRHIHLSYEALFVYEGEVAVVLNDTTYKLRANDAILIMPGQPHSIETKAFSRSYMCVFSPDNVEEFRAFSMDCELVNPVFTLADFAFVDVFKDERHNRFIQKSFLYLVCGMAARAGVRKPEEDEETRPIFKIIKYINDNHLKNITLRTMADELKYNYTYLSNYFNKHFKTGFSSTVNSYRVNYAKQLLSDSRYPMSQIAIECGFTTVRNFNRAFLQFEKITPKAYREAHLEKNS